MGAGVSRHGQVRRKVQAVNAFEDAGKRHRRQKNPKKSNDVAMREKAKDMTSSDRGSRSHWMRVKERTISKTELEARSALRLSDFNKVVRKRTLEKDDDVPITIPYVSNEKVEPEELCHVCSVYTGRETYPCRICYKVYHESCLRKLGQCNDPASSVLLKKALKPTGWSCQNCDDLSSLLTEEELHNLFSSLDRYEVAQDSSIGLEDFMEYRKRCYGDQDGGEVPKDALQEDLARFHRIDKDNTGSITWWEFINFESIRILKKRNKNSIVHLLSPREIEIARRLFRVYDDGCEGNITEFNAKKTIAAFYTLFIECDDTLNGFAVLSKKDEELSFVLNESLSFTMDCEPNGPKSVSWQDYLLELSLYILAARPNLSPVPVESSEWTKGDLFGVSMILPLISTHARDLGATPTVTGIIGSTYGALQLMSSPIVGQWSDNAGRKFCLLFCLLASAGGYFLMSFSTTLIVLMLSRIPTGIFKHSQSVSRSYLTDVSSRSDQSGVLGTFNAASSIGFILGPMVGGRLAETSGGFYKVTFLCTAIFVLNAVFVWAVVEDKESSNCNKGNTPLRNDSEDSLKRLNSGEENFSPKLLLQSLRTFDWKNLWDLFLIKFCLGFSILLYRSNFSLTMREIFHMSPSNIGYLISYSATIAALSGFLVGRISKLFRSDAQIVLYMSVFQTFTLLSLSIVSNIVLYVICYTPLSIITSMLRVSSTSLTIQRCGGKNVGGIIGMSQSVMSLARMLSPFISGLVMEVSYSGTAVVGSLVSSVAVILLILRPQEPKVYKEKVQ
ncbi:uncharacterized protein LOC133201504 [Saccostrea echinata]|uniref:uncharacterized protein LOC133201504 n=1 Tax=Saccostrea echinata TaxID=191078 RepID=UPI002A841485|nr:uncharacterized protein LOC133201504 [Saccostrea echinata]